MRLLRKIGIRLTALSAFAGLMCVLSPLSAQDAADYYRIIAAPAKPAAAQPAVSKRATESKDRGVVVYVMRGWLDVFSTGMDELATKMKGRGINAIAMSHSDHLIVAQQIIDRHKQGIKERPVLIGHSLGANATAALAAELAKAGIHVPLIVMFDPTVVQKVPSNVGRAVNFYQSNNGWGVKVERGPGFKGKLENIDLFKEELGHTGIDKSPRLHLQSISFVQGLRGVRDPDETPRPARPKTETASEPKHTDPASSAEHKSEQKSESKAETKTEPKADAPAATVATPAPAPSSGEPKSNAETKAPAAPASSEAKPASEKPAEKPAPEKSTSGGQAQPGLFSDVKRPAL